jgi:subtilisin family serine protease
VAEKGYYGIAGGKRIGGACFMIALLGVLFCTATILFADSGPRFVEGEVLVKYRKRMDNPAGGNGRGRKARTFKLLKCLSKQRGQSYGLMKSSRKTTAELLAELEADPDVVSVSPNYLRRVYGSYFPTDPDFDKQWPLHNTGQVVNLVFGTPDADLDFPEGMGLARDYTGEVVVAVMDTGVDYKHPDLAGNMWTNLGENPTNSVDDDGNGYTNDYYGYDFAGDLGAEPDSDPMDVDTLPGHGTHVAGIIAAIPDNGYGIVGVCGIAKIMSLKVSSDGINISTYAWMEAMDYAMAMKTGGVNIVAINASFGDYGYSSVEMDAVAAAGDVGIVFCAASGNDGVDNDVTPVYPAGYDLPNVIAVAATGQDDNLWEGSNYGEVTVDVGAPGVNIYSCRPSHISTRASVTADPDTWSAVGFIYAGISTGTTGIVYDCGQGYPSDFPVEVSGNIALIERGTIMFREKVENAMAAGATAAIIYNNVPGGFAGTLQYPGDRIPAVSMSQTDGQALLGRGNVSATVVNRADASAAYIFYAGTSMACPHVTGATALMAASYPNDNAVQRVARVLACAEPLPLLAGVVSTGGRLNLARGMDTDTDTIPDWWELDYVPSVVTMDGTTDTDGDRALDLHEYLAGTHPTDTSSCLRVLGAEPRDGEAIVTWASVGNKRYTVLSAPDMLLSFTPLASNILATPPENTHTDIAAGVKQNFYRVELEEE